MDSLANTHGDARGLARSAEASPSNIYPVYGDVCQHGSAIIAIFHYQPPERPPGTNYQSDVLLTEILAGWL